MATYTVPQGQLMLNYACDGGYASVLSQALWT